MKKYIHGDCMDKKNGLPSLPDNFIDLAIVDPPYALGIDGRRDMGKRKKWGKSYNEKKHISKNWDNIIPSENYFQELNRVSKNWIVWGGNYFSKYFDRVDKMIEWDKCCDKTSFSHFEIAFTSFKGRSEKIKIPIQRESQRRIHPTQKPIDLYKEILRRFAKEGMLILDTHVGSASSLIAFESLGYDYLAFEIDKDYYFDSKKRMSKGIERVLF